MIHPSSCAVDMPASLAIAISGCRITGSAEMNTAPAAPYALTTFSVRAHHLEANAAGKDVVT